MDTGQNRRTKEMFMEPKLTQKSGTQYTQNNKNKAFPLHMDIKTQNPVRSSIMQI